MPWHYGTEMPRVLVIAIDKDSNIPFNRDCLLAVPSGEERQLQMIYKIIYLLLHYNFKAM
jgi:hypothetical protein